MFQLRITVKRTLRYGENIHVTVIFISYGILTKPRLAIVNILIGTLDSEANNVIATMSLTNKLLGQLIKQSAQFDV